MGPATVAAHAFAGSNSHYALPRPIAVIATYLTKSVHVGDQDGSHVEGRLQVDFRLSAYRLQNHRHGRCYLARHDLKEMVEQSLPASSLVLSSIAPSRDFRRRIENV